MKKQQDEVPVTRISLRQTPPVGFRVEVNALDDPAVVRVVHRPDELPLYPSLGEWALAIPENIITSRGFALWRGPMDRSGPAWKQVAGKPNTIFYERTQVPPATVKDTGAVPEYMVDRQAHVHYRAELAVTENTLDVGLTLTNLSAEPTSLLTHLCNRFTGRGYFWGWRDRTYIQIDGEWKNPPASTPQEGKWFWEGNLPEQRTMEFFRKGSSTDPNARVTSPLVCMASENRHFTVVCGSRQGSMVFINPDNPCVHSEPYTQTIEPQETVAQIWSMRVYGLPYAQAADRFEREVHV